MERVDVSYKTSNLILSLSFERIPSFALFGRNIFRNSGEKEGGKSRYPKSGL